MKPETQDRLLFWGVPILAILIVVLLIFLRTEGGKCIHNPITYYNDLKNVTCYCYP